jgi:glycosyltransferase involved in cell wall biosynthesis
VPAGVALRGVVADLGAVLHRSAVAVAPVLAGSGLKIKLLDYVAHGLPVVATGAAVEGFEPAPDRPFLVSDDAKEFAQIAARLASDTEGFARREKQALDYCRLYAPDRVFEALTEALEPMHNHPDARVSAVTLSTGPARVESQTDAPE